MELLFILACIWGVLYLIYKSIPAFSKPWRVKVVKDDRHTNTVMVILAKRFAGGMFQSSDRIEIKKGIVVNTDDPREFKLRLKAAVEQAEEYAKTLQRGKNLTRTSKLKLPRLRKDKTDATPSS